MPKFKDPAGQITEVVVDVEWGAFGDNGVLNFMKTEFDNAVDTNSLLVGSFTYASLTYLEIHQHRVHSFIRNKKTTLFFFSTILR